jgi:hypothetical protein
LTSPPDRAVQQHADASGAGNVIVQAVGDGNTIVVGYPYLTLTRYLGRRIAPESAPPGGDADLLSPYAFSISLVGGSRCWPISKPG